MPNVMDALLPPPPGLIPLGRIPGNLLEQNRLRTLLDNPNLGSIHVYRIPCNSHGVQVSWRSVLLRITEGGIIERVEEEVYCDGRPTRITVT